MYEMVGSCSKTCTLVIKNFFTIPCLFLYKIITT